MKKVIGFCRRFIASLMICFILSFTALGGYMGVAAIPVQATGVVEVEIFMWLIEAVMSSMGMSFSSEADLYNAALGLESISKSYPGFKYKGVSIFEKFFYDFTYKSQYIMTRELLEWVESYCYNMASNVVSSACDVSAPIISSQMFDSSVCIFDKQTLCDAGLFYGLYDWYGSSSTSIPDRYSSMLDSPVIVTQLTPGDGKATLRIYFAEYFSGSAYADIENYFAVCDTDDSGATRFTYVNGSDTTDTRGWNYYKFTYDYASEVMTPDISKSGSGSKWLTLYSFDGNEYFVIDESIQTRVFVNSAGLGVYDSIDDYNVTQFANIYNAKSPVYGLTSSGKKYQADSSTGQVTLEYFEPYITEQVSSAVSNALAANPSITEAELNALAAEIVAAQKETADAIDKNTATLSSLLSSILDEVKRISTNVSKIATEGSSALDLSDIKEQFKVIEGGASNDSGDDEEPEEGTVPKYWVPTEFSISSFLAPLLEYFSEPLSIITQFQDAMLEKLTAAEEWIANVPVAIVDGMSPLLEEIQSCIEELPLTEIHESIVSLPAEIAEALGDGLALEVPDISISEFPEAIDYTGPLARIVELLESLFVIDTVAIGEAASGFSTMWQDKIPLIGELSSLYDNFAFSDDYDYPKIEIKTPENLKPFYSDDVIVLCDFAEYAVYILWVRNLVKACLWFSFGLSVISHFKTSLHIG